MSKYTASLHSIMPLTPKGLKMFKRYGRKELIKGISEELAQFELDDLAHLSALTMCIVGDANVEARAKKEKGGKK